MPAPLRSLVALLLAALTAVGPACAAPPAARAVPAAAPDEAEDGDAEPERKAEAEEEVAAGVPGRRRPTAPPPAVWVHTFRSSRPAPAARPPAPADRPPHFSAGFPLRC